MTTSDLIFSPQAGHDFSRILGDLKRANLSITNRLRSIREDASFVDDVAAAFGGRPLVANERCGSWYVRPEAKKGFAYFKSTDGHTGQWKFSTRRLNLHLLRLIEEGRGCIIVDSTRRGKRIPDALSKTVPIWCAVLNTIFFPSRSSAHEVHVPPQAVSASEHSQMLALVSSFVASFLKLNLDVPSLRSQLGKPLRPVWVTQDSPLPAPEDAQVDIFEDCHPVICCTSSRCVVGGAEMGEGGYIQGAGDDTENWARGFTPAVFWRHAEVLAETPEADLPGLIARLIAEDEEERVQTGSGKKPEPVNEWLSVGDLSSARGAPGCVVVLRPEVTKADDWVKSPVLMEVGVGKHKLASRNLRVALPEIYAFVKHYLYLYGITEGTSDGQAAGQGLSKHILVACETGKDISVGVALAVLSSFSDDKDNIVEEPLQLNLNKDIIRVRMGRIATAVPEANPSRSTLQSVNSFLMDWRG